MPNAIYQELIAIANDPGLKEATEHPNWDEAYASVVASQEDFGSLPFRIKDVDDVVLFLYLVKQGSFYVENGLLMSEIYMAEPEVWKDGKWMSTLDLEDGEE